MYSNIIHTATLHTPIGEMVAAAAEEGICLLEFADRPALKTELKELVKFLHAEIKEGEHAHFKILERQLQEYFQGKRTAFDLPLLTPGTDFQQRVWKKLLEIPFGTTRSYKEQAIALDNLPGIRAIASANGKNRIAIIIPCHRIIGENGSMVGYGGGVWRKRWLLDFESEKAGKGRQADLFEKNSNK